ncbi:zinc finger protein [Penicillium capsulatum]|nr:zinc finger protein [Penicillium capsulatum]
MHKCASCDAVFCTFEDCDMHMYELNHWAVCETCNRVFRTQQALAVHMQENAHYKCYCERCDRIFNDNQVYRAHLQSKNHRSSTSKCLFCESTFVTASAVTNHIESSSCRNAPLMNRDAVLRLVRARDPTGSPQVSRRGPPPHPNAMDSFNGQKWECCLCHRQFNNSPALKQHLLSPAHRGRDYRCPNQSKCARQFTSMSSLFNHLESHSCGYMPRSEVQAYLMQVLAGKEMFHRR